jgi:phage baseplate assembly protein gpV
MHRAIVNYSNSTTGDIHVKIPSVTGLNSVIALSKIGRKAPWVVPDIGEQILITSDDSNFTNVFWIQTDAVPTFTYKVGDTGPGGGVIFFVDRYDEYAGFTYLEVAPVSTQVPRSWATNVNSNQSTTVSGADSRALGAGYQNTIDIVSQSGNVAATCAAKYCADLVSGGQSDWYLPSISELQLIRNVVYNQLDVGSFINGGYWSSTESAANAAWYHSFHTALLDTQGKSQNQYVRPVRRF